jgi:16S rRNA (guanine1207-N2)-methyltransferase
MDTITTLLFQRYADVQFGQRLLTLGVAPDLAAEWAVRVGTGQVWAITDDLLAFQQTERLAQQGHLSALHPLFSADLSGLPAIQFDACVLDILSYPNRACLHSLLWEAARRLSPGRAVYTAGPNDAGIQSLEKRLRETWGNVSVLAYKKGHRILQARRPEELPPLQEEPPAARTLSLRGQRFTLTLRPGVFARGDLDPATRMLAETAEITGSSTTLDLGCGSGILGMLAARLNPTGEVYLVDSSAVALAAAQANCLHNDLRNTRVLASDGVAAVRDIPFDLVLCNPPFHHRHSHSTETALRFIREVGDILAPGGRFYLVANQFLRYEPAMCETFGSVTTLASDGRYKVLLAERAAP